MGVDNRGDASECLKILRDISLNNASLSFTEQRCIDKAINWVGGDSTNPLTVVEWMIVSRVVGENIAIRFETEEKYYYLTFDVDRSRNVVIDPDSVNKKVPVEETNLIDEFDEKQAVMVKSDEMIKKKYEAVTAIARDNKETKLVLGRYTGDVTVTTTDGEKLYSSKTTFSLPEPMQPEEAIEWVQTNESESVEEVVTVNHVQNWDF